MPSRAFNPWIAALASGCATVDVIAIGMIPLASTVVQCGTDWVLAYLTIIVIFSVGGFPVAIAVAAIVLMKAVPRLHSPWPWLGSALLLGTAAAASIALATRHAMPSDPGRCSL